MGWIALKFSKKYAEVALSAIMCATISSKAFEIMNNCYFKAFIQKQRRFTVSNSGRGRFFKLSRSERTAETVKKAVQGSDIFWDNIIRSDSKKNWGE